MDAAAVGMEDDDGARRGLAEDVAGEGGGRDGRVGVSRGDGPLDRDESEVLDETEGFGVPVSVGETEEDGGAAEEVGEDGAGAEQLLAEASGRMTGEVEVEVAVVPDGEERMFEAFGEGTVPFEPASADEEGGGDVFVHEEIDDVGVEGVGPGGRAEVEGEVDDRRGWLGKGAERFGEDAEKESEHPGEIRCCRRRGLPPLPKRTPAEEAEAWEVFGEVAVGEEEPVGGWRREEEGFAGVAGAAGEAWERGEEAGRSVPGG